MAAIAQSDIKFEVAAVKVNKSGEIGVSGGFQPGGRYAVSNYSLRSLIAAAYMRPQVNPDFLISGGPAWLDQTRFDLDAKANGEFPAGPDGPTAPRRVMLQQLLADRFGLKVHHETRQGQIFALAVAKNDKSLGPEIHPSSADCANPVATSTSCFLRIAPGNIAFGGMALSALVNLLPRFVDRIVIDATNLTGRYDVQLSWTPGPTEWIAPPAANRDLPTAEGPSLVTALREQLGLRLQPQVGPIDMLVIDAAAMPTEN